MLTSLLVNSWDIADVGGIWIGLTDATQRGVYNWTDGTAVDYTSWFNGQPDESLGSCVRATLQPGKMSWLFWQDDSCSRQLPYACAMYSSKFPKLTVRQQDPGSFHSIGLRFQMFPLWRAFKVNGRKAKTYRNVHVFKGNL